MWIHLKNEFLNKISPNKCIYINVNSPTKSVFTIAVEYKITMQKELS